MFNNIALNVFTGLVLIYLLYSLFITVFSEMLATWMNLRARILRVSIEKMLNDGLQEEKLDGKTLVTHKFHIVKRFFLKEFDDFKYSFAGKFYATPSIKYLSDNGGEKRTAFTQSKPSYISADMFADSLMQLLADKGVGTTSIEKINFCLKFNTHHIQPDSLMNLRDHVQKAGADINIVRRRFISWYNETQDRATGWYKKKLQLILFWLGFIVAIVFNVDSIQIAKILSRDKDARNQLVQMGIAVLKDSSKYSGLISKDDTAYHRSALDSGYSLVTKDIEQAGMILGLGWKTDQLLMPYEIEINMKSGVDQLKHAAQELGHFNVTRDSIQHLHDALQKNDQAVQRLLLYTKECAVDTLLFNYKLATVRDSISIRAIRDSLEKKQNLIKGMTDSFNILQAKRSLYLIELSIVSAVADSLVSFVDSISGNAGKIVAIHSIAFDTVQAEADKNPSNAENIAIRIFTGKKYPWYKKAYYIIKKSFTTKRLFGLFITALMLSLGAPFWFDLLKKLVALRGAGVKPEEKKLPANNVKPLYILPINNNAADQKPVTTLNPVADIYEQALLKSGAEIKNVPGVKSVFTVGSGNDKKLQVNVTDEATKNEVEKQYKDLKVGSITINPVIIVSGIPQIQQSHIGEISNASGRNGFGAMGCILYDKRDNSRHVLSCWHVMKGNTDYDYDDNDTTILDSGRNMLATRWAGGIAGSLDFALAEFAPGRKDNNSLLQEKLNLSALTHRFITDVDVNKQISVRYYNWSSEKVQTGKIYTRSSVVEISYLDKVRDIEDVIVLTNADSGESISQPGNSGSIIFDDNGFAIAMIIAGDLKYSYAIKLSNIFSLHDEMEILKT